MEACNDSRRDFTADPGEAGAQEGGTGPETIEPDGAAGSVVDMNGGEGGEGGTGEPAPTVFSADPARVYLGDTVTLTGEHLLPAPTVVLAGESIVPSKPIGDDRLTFVVPESLALSECEQQLPLTVHNSNGFSDALEVTALLPEPHFDAPAYVGAAGTSLTLTGNGLMNARIALNGHALAVSGGSDNSLNIDIPRDAAANSTLVAETDCGNATVPLQLKPPAPRLLASDITETVSGAILLLTVELSNGATVAAVRIGGSVIDPTDKRSFRWLTQPDSGKRRTLAVRLPSDVELGTLELALEGVASASNALPIKVLDPPKLVPPGSPTITLLPDAIADFPIGTLSPFPQVDITTGKKSAWSYDLSLTRVHIPNTTKCETSGTITGYERLCPTDDHQTCELSNGCKPTLKCYPLTGKYTADATNNVVTIEIDRATGPGPEEYVGGWSNVEEVSQNANVLVLRSKRTGMQLTIQHRSSAICQ